MAANSNSLTMTWEDVGGYAVRIGVLVAAAVVDPSGAAVIAIRTAIAALSAAKNTRASLGFEGPIADTTTPGAYNDVEDKAAMTFLDSNGQTHTWRIPGPNPNIFLGTDVVDVTNPQVIAFVNAVKNHSVTRGGATLALFKGGRRIRHKREKK